MTTIQLPTLHKGQADIYRHRKRLNAVRCGRRFGKTLLMSTIAIDFAACGYRVGVFTPEYKQLIEPYGEIRAALHPVVSSSSKTEGKIRTLTGGVVDFWSLNDNDLAGRGREYHVVLLDEVAFCKSNMTSIWERSIKPTLLTTHGQAWLFSTPNGVDEENFFYRACTNNTDPPLGFTEFHAPTSRNPYVPAEELETERLKNHPLVFQQEFLAEFVSWAGQAFFELDKLLINGQPVPVPKFTDTVFAVIDTAVKTGTDNDGTAVVYCAKIRYGLAYKLLVLDWDIVQIEGALLETWLPSVFSRLEFWAQKANARQGSIGAFIEDAQSGTILLQQALRHGWPARAIETKLTSVGKDGRALNVSGYHYRGLVKILDEAYNKTTTYKGVTRNQLISQVTGFRIGDKDAAKRADDLLDTYTYALSLALGDVDGY